MVVRMGRWAEDHPVACLVIKADTLCHPTVVVATSTILINPHHLSCSAWVVAEVVEMVAAVRRSSHSVRSYDNRLRC